MVGVPGCQRLGDGVPCLQRLDLAIAKGEMKDLLADELLSYSGMFYIITQPSPTFGSTQLQASGHSMMMGHLVQS